MKAVIPAAGFGTRFIPATKAQPKEMLPIYDKPALQYLVEEAVASGCDDILIVTGKNKRSIEDHFDKSYELEYTLQKAGKDRDLKKIRKITDLADICYVRQKDQKGIYDAIKCSQKHIGDEPFAVLLGGTLTKSEIPCTKQLISAYEKCNAPVVSLKPTKGLREKYGIVETSKVEGDIYKINQIYKKAPDNRNHFTIMGRFIIEPDIFDIIDETEADFRGNIKLTDIFSKLDSVYGVRFRGKNYNIANRLDWLKTSIDYALDDDEFKNDLIDYMKTYI